MTKNHAVILHGMPSKDEYYDKNQPKPIDAHWLPWLQGELIKLNFTCHMPEMPIPYNPTYGDWSKTYEFIHRNCHIDLVIGHSLGAGFIIQWLSLNPSVSIKNLVLVAPWVDPNHETEFFSKLNTIEMQTNQIHLLYSTDDELDIIESVQRITDLNPNIKLHQYTDKGHFTLTDLGENTCIEVLNIIKGSL